MGQNRRLLVTVRPPQNRTWRVSTRPATTGGALPVVFAGEGGGGKVVEGCLLREKRSSRGVVEGGVEG